MRQSSRATCTGLNVLIGSTPMNDAAQADEFHKTILEAYLLQSEDRESFENWVIRENRHRNDRPVETDPNHNAYYVASKLPPNLYKRFYSFCEKNHWSKSTAVKFAIHQLLSSKQNG